MVSPTLNKTQFDIAQDKRIKAMEDAVVELAKRSGMAVTLPKGMPQWGDHDLDGTPNFMDPDAARLTQSGSANNLNLASLIANDKSVPELTNLLTSLVLLKLLDTLSNGNAASLLAGAGLNGTTSQADNSTTYAEYLVDYDKLYDAYECYTGTTMAGLPKPGSLPQTYSPSALASMKLHYRILWEDYQAQTGQAPKGVKSA